MNNIVSSLRLLSILTVALIIINGCGSSGSSGNDSTIEGSLRSAARAAGAGVAGVNVSALGDHTVTDKNGNFTIKADGESFSGGAVQFSFSGHGANESSVILNNVLGGPGVTGYVSFVLEPNGAISGQSTDAAGNVISSSVGRGCSADLRTFGGNGELWKPVAESTGRVVILMPAEYRHAAVEILNSRNEAVDQPLKRSCCDHNGGREHIFLRRTARDLATTGLPLTVVFSFNNGRTECRTVPNPTQRYE